MKNEKLKSLLNKVVEYNDPNAYGGNGCHFKAFLYKKTSGYYFKVVEVIAGTDLAFNDLIPLKEGDEDYLVVADKPKLMRVDKKSWHYRLVQYVLKSNAPTPQDMQNGCPYFWLAVFSMLVVPFIQLYKLVKWIVLLIPKGLFWVLEQMVNTWIAGLDDEAAYEIYNEGRYSSNVKMPQTAKIFFDNSDDSFFEFFLSKKYKNLDKADPDYSAKRVEIREKWTEWRADVQKRRDAQSEISRQKADEKSRREAIQAEKRAVSKAKWDARVDPIIDGLDEIGDWFKKTFTVQRGRVNMIVKRTKQFVGMLVTLVILAATYFAVNYIALGLMVAADWSIAHWAIFLGIALGGVVIGIGYLFYILISSWGQAVVNKYRRGKKVWYIEPFIYVVWFPLKYIAIAIAFLAVWVIFYPLKFIFYTLLFRWFFKPIGLFLAKLAVGLVKGIGSSSGIFGEYFGASYSDYCPGIEWTGFDEDED